jgi:hypothetical protein
VPVCLNSGVTVSRRSGLRHAWKSNSMKRTEFNWADFRFYAIYSAVFATFALLFALADMANYARLGDRFTPFSVAYPISALTYDETSAYVPCARRFFETSNLKSELDVFELRDLVGAFPIAHCIIIGSMAKTIGSLEGAWVVAHGIFPALTWLLFFACARQLGLPIATAFLLATATSLIPFGPRNFFLLGQDALIQPLELTRMAPPGLSFLFLLLAAMGVSQAILSGRIVTGIIAGVLVGINFYTYYFCWMALGLGLSTWLGVAAFLRRWKDVKTLCIIGLAAIVTGVPFFTVIALQSQTAINFMARLGPFTRDMSAAGLGLAAILSVPVIWLYVRARMQPLVIVLAFVMVGGALGLNAQVLTGYDAQHWGHFTNRIIQPLFFFLSGAAALQCLPKIPHWRWLCAVATLALVSLGAYRQISVAGNIGAAHDRYQNSVQMVESLPGRIDTASVVGSSDPQVITLLPAITTLWTFVPLGVRTMASNEEILRRFLLIRKLEGATLSDVHADFDRKYPSDKEDRDLSYVLFLRAFDGNDLHSRIDQLWSKVNLAKDLSVRRLDFLLTTVLPPALPQSSGWSLEQKGGAIGMWKVFQLRPIQP